jgi:hypothetical protein
MVIASELGDYDDRHNLPTANKSAYASASAMSKENEKGQEMLMAISGFTFEML